MTAKKRRDSADEVSFEGLVDFGSIPPPGSGPNPVDVHAASTAVADLPPGLLEELRRAAKTPDAQATGERRKAEPPAEASRFTDEAPTAPGTAGHRRPALPDAEPSSPSRTSATPPEGGGDLLAAVNAALAANAARVEADAASHDPRRGHADVAGRMPAFAFPPPTPEVARPTPEPVRRRRTLRALALLVLIVLLAAAGAWTGRRFARR